MRADGICQDRGVKGSAGVVPDGMGCKRVGRGFTGSVCTVGRGCEGAGRGCTGSVRAGCAGCAGVASVCAGKVFTGSVRAVCVGAVGKGVGLGFTASVCTFDADADWIFATSAGDKVPPSAGSCLAAP